MKTLPKLCGGHHKEKRKKAVWPRETSMYRDFMGAIILHWFKNRSNIRYCHVVEDGEVLSGPFEVHKGLYKSICILNESISLAALRGV